jgi:N-acetylmuramic acid 6-phosphate (MurNAc-6-P) etherase
MSETGLGKPEAETLMTEAEFDLRVAIVMHRSSADREHALDSLEKHQFVIESAVKSLSGR